MLVMALGGLPWDHDRADDQRALAERLRAALRLCGCSSATRPSRQSKLVGGSSLMSSAR